MVSVVLATFNRAHLLRRAIDSVLRQSILDWQLIVVDDGSTDNTRSVVERYSSADVRVNYLHQPNAGLALARNAGMRHADAGFVTFLDSDDEYRPDHLEMRLAYFEAHPETDLLHGGVEIVGGPDYVRDVNDPNRHVALSECFIGGTFFMRWQVFQELDGFRPPDFGTDYEFAQRAQGRFNVRKIEASTYIYHRETPDSLCNLMEKSCG